MRKKRQRTRLRLRHVQAIQIGELRERLGESGYFIFPIARRFRTHKQDFLAMRRERPREFLIVKPKNKGFISLKPYCLKSQHQDIAAIVDEFKAAGCLVRWLAQLSLQRSNLRLEHFLTEPGKREYARLMAQ